MHHPRTSRSRGRRAFLASLALACGFGLAVAPLAADVVIDGDPGFIMKVEAALKKIRDAGGKPASDLGDLEGSGNDHVISQGENGTGYNNKGDANSKPAGGTGKGTGTSVHWNPDDSGTTKGGVPYDPCITLAHELSHAHDGDKGMRDPRPDPGGSGIPTNEVNACANENRFRKSLHPPKPPRTDYDCVDLPASAVCPPKSAGAHARVPGFGFAGGMTAAPFVSPAAAGPLLSPVIVAPAPVPVPGVRLDAVASSPQYLAGETVDILITLTNETSQTLGLSNRVEGNIQVVSFQRNGVAVPVRKTAIDFFEGLGSRLSNSLVSVTAGQSLQSTWHSVLDPVQGAEALDTVQFSDSDDDGLTLYGLGSPGTYSLTIVYQYPGPTHSFPGTVYLRQTNTVTVSFRIL